MKHFSCFFLMGLLCAAPIGVRAEINVFACEPEWASLAAEIGGDKVNVFSATHARQDPHHIRARPSLIAKARRADLIFCSGGGLEVGWLPLLLQKSGGDTQPGTVGYLMASEYVTILEKPTVVDRSLGDVHPEGNPHVHLDPRNLMLIAEQLSGRLSAIESENADFYQRNLEEFSVRLTKSIERWQVEAQLLKEIEVVVHHKGFSYLLNWLGMIEAASLEPKPGIPPTVSHLESLLKQLKSRPASLIIRTAYESGDASEWLSEKAGIPAIVLPYTIDGDPQSGDLFSLLDRTLSLLIETVNAQQ